MPNVANANRNHLYGILALQMDLITHDQLAEAIDTWLRDKSKPLGQILIELGALLPEKHALLEPLVERHIANHQQDAAKSLAALSSSGGVRARLRHISDSDVQASLAHLAERTFAGAPGLDRPASRADGRRGRFRIVRPHARGGLGEVFVAEDTELGRRVALKEIQQRYSANPEARARFITEAEITGALEHPGIVPVYGLGSYEDGRPFYAMRFIRGASLHDAIRKYHDNKTPQSEADRNIEFRGLLGRFVDVCHAIAYAHSRGVLHRDLKPGNIMLGKYGETLVVDWGLAKAGLAGEATPHPEMESDMPQPRLSASGSGTPTQMGQALGTPSYMSPEQADGRLDDLGPATDVYSLGATLYAILTGKPPIGGPAGEAIVKVIKGEFPPPHKLKSNVSRALEAVCLKAMALKPEDRYADAAILAEDVEHWLADEPVTAWREPMAVRLRRWMRRHRAVVSAAAGLLFMAIAALVVGLVVVEREKDKAESARKLALETLDIMVTNEALKSVKAQPNGPLPHQIEFYNRVVDLYDQLSKTGADPAADQSKRATTCTNVAMAFVSLRRLEEAENAIRQALSIYTRLAADRPNDAERRRCLAQSHFNLGFVLARRGEVQSAETAYRRALEIRQQLADEDSKSSQNRQDLVEANTNLSNLFQGMGKDRLPQAEEFLRRALAEQKRLFDTEPKNRAYRNGMGEVQENLGHLLADAGKTEPAAESYLAALAVYDTLIRDFADRDDYRSEKAWVLGSLGKLRLAGNQPIEAEKHYRNAIRVRQEQVKRLPGDPSYRNELADCYRGLGTALCDQRKLADAKVTAEECAKMTGATGHCFVQAIGIVGRCLGGQEVLPDDESHKRSVDWLSRAKVVGVEPADIREIEQDADFATVRSRPEFQKLLEELKAKPK